GSKLMQIHWKIFVSSLFVVLLMACQSEPKMEETEETDINEEAVETRAEVEKPTVVSLTNEDEVGVGEAVLKQTEEGVEITVKASHLPPGEHGFHIHEKGICEAPTFESSGGHFNPDDKKHGFDHPEGPHIGDIENLEVKEDGTVDATFINDRVTLEKDKANSLFSEEGTALVIHADPDDYYSQPAGDAGDRIACGVISPPKEASLE